MTVPDGPAGWPAESSQGSASWRLWTGEVPWRPVSGLPAQPFDPMALSDQVRDSWGKAAG